MEIHAGYFNLPTIMHMFDKREQQLTLYRDGLVKHGQVAVKVEDFMQRAERKGLHVVKIATKEKGIFSLVKCKCVNCEKKIN